MKQYCVVAHYFDGCAIIYQPFDDLAHIVDGFLRFIETDDLIGRMIEEHDNWDTALICRNRYNEIREVMDS